MSWLYDIQIVNVNYMHTVAVLARIYTRIIRMMLIRINKLDAFNGTIWWIDEDIKFMIIVDAPAEFQLRIYRNESD